MLKQCCFLLVFLLFAIKTSYSQNIAGYVVDTTFKVTMNGLSNDYTGYVGRYLIDSNGTILITGNFAHLLNQNLPSRAVRLLPDGSIDTSFHYPFAGTLTFEGPSIVKKHKGWYYFANQEHGVMSRVDYYGHPDTNFNRHYLPVIFFEELWDIYIQDDDKILCSGYFQRNSNAPSYTMIRLNADGTYDSTFQETLCHYNNTIIFPLGDTAYLVGGKQYDDAGTRYALWRIFPDGSLDSSFNTHCTQGMAFQIMQLPDGKLLTAGAFEHPSQPEEFNLARWNADGSIDTSFHPQQNIFYFITDGPHIFVSGILNYFSIDPYCGIAVLDSLGDVDTTVSWQQIGPDTSFFHKYPGVGYFQRTASGDILASGEFASFNGFQTFGMLRFKHLYTGISNPETHDSTLFSIYPNPAGNVLNVNFSNHEFVKGALRVYDYLGRLMIAQRVNSQNVTLDLSTLSDGLFFINFSNDSGNLNLSKKFIHRNF